MFAKRGIQECERKGYIKSKNGKGKDEIKIKIIES